MALIISHVEADDVGQLVRKVEYPAQQDNPLTRLMFPRSTNLIQQGSRDDEIKWAIDGLLEAVYAEDEFLYKACGRDGTPIGLIGWTSSPGASSEEVGKGNFTTGRSRAVEGASMKSRTTCCPSSLDVITWLDISKRLRQERQRVLRSYEGRRICRITFMAVDPDYQRQGVGSMLMEKFCHEMEDSNSDAFVLSSPAGVRLYSKFGFRAVGVVETQEGTFTSLLRSSNL